MSFVSQPVKKVVLRILEDLSGPVALKAAILLRYSDYDQLVNMTVDPNNYSSGDSELYWRDTSAVSLLRKCQGLPTSTDLHQKAVETFFNCERSCYRSNLRLFPYLSPGLWADADMDVSVYFSRARKIISEILGPLPSLDSLRVGFGPGATYGDRGRFTTVPDKITSKPTLTPKALCFVPNWASSLWAKASQSLGNELLLVDGNRFTSVPKDSTKNRGIAVEPSLNLFYQLGFGRFIRSKLRRAGIDLADGQVVHRRIAREASIQGHLSTIDLSNASDSICKNLVRLLLPPQWFYALDSLRSPFTEIEGKRVLLEKFSSMGNGFTFELETLIFLGLCMAISDDLQPSENLWVYGDDIIIPTEFKSSVMACFAFCGFEINSRKSFFSGPFRESCGGDFFEGVDVRPFFLKELPSEPQHWIAFANGLRRASQPGVRYRRMRGSWNCLLDNLPNHIRVLRGPQDLGDIVIHDDPEKWITKTRHSIRRIRVYRPTRPTSVSWANFKPEVVLASAVYGLPWNSGRISTRGPVEGYKIGWVPYS